LKQGMDEADFNQDHWAVLQKITDS